MADSFLKVWMDSDFIRLTMVKFTEIQERDHALGALSVNLCPLPSAL